MKPLDKIDRKILHVLQKNGRMFNVDLSKQVNLSPTPCLDRVRRLERDGYIEGYHAKLNAEKMKVSFLTFMTVSLDQTNEGVFEGFKTAIENIDEIVECHMVGGGFDYLIKIRTESMAAYRQLMGERFSEIPGIASTNSYFVMEEIKNTRFYKIPET
ncbi:MAG: Lrp/AsnC ligand binding domain-containing protein [Robiginitomaculum sp.]|nr:Lrp/AsnC ligand binding domain-containing protein [Robiginitomaculum sp.]